MHWYLDVIKNYIGFSGRATRTEFWMFTLINAIVLLIATLLDYLLGSHRLIYYLYSLAVFLPSLAVIHTAASRYRPDGMVDTHRGDSDSWMDCPAYL